VIGRRVASLAKLQINGDIHDIQGILFDKDGTLIELHSLWSAWFKKLCDEIDYQHPQIKLNKIKLADSIGLDIDNNKISQKGPLAIGTMQDIAVIMAHHLYLKAVPWNEAVQIVQNSFKKVHETIDWEELLQPLQGLINFLNNANKSGIKMGVVTSDDTDIAKKHLSILKIDHFFDAIIGSDQVSLPKPFPEIGLKACRLMNTHSEKVIVIGDTDGDMNLGKNLNSIANIGVVTGDPENNHHFTEANYIINHYDQITIL